MIIHKFIVHVLDKNSDVPILNDFEGKVNQEVEGFFQKMIKRVTRDDDLRKAVFKNYTENTIRKCCEQIIYDESTFVENSKEIAAYLFDVMKVNSDLESCDLAVCLYTVKEEKNVAIIKIDYKKLYTHSIEFVDEKFNIQIVSNEVGIQETQRIKQAALIGVNSMNDEYQFRALDKDSEKSGIPTKFIGEFINGEKIDDDKHKTKVFKTSADNWITNALANDIKQAEDARSILNYTLKEQQQVDVAEFAERAIKDEDLKEGFKELMEEKGIDESFSVDKKWVEKKLKKRNIKTDNGFEIKGNLTDFEDPMKYSIRKNEDGTVDIVIKNVNFFEEK